MTLPAFAARAGRKDVLSQFRAHFAESSTELYLILQTRLALQVEVASLCAREQGMLAAPALAASNGSTPWRFDADAFANFQALGALQLSVSGSRSVVWGFFLRGESERAAFEAAAHAAADSGTLDAGLAARLRLPLANSPTATVASPAAPAAMHLAIWDVAPPASRGFVMFDIMSNGSSLERRQAINASIVSGGVTATDLLQRAYSNPTANPYAPAVIIFAPAFAGASLVGMCGVPFEWATLVAAALPSFVNSITAVLASPTGRLTTITLDGGASAVPQSGDVHDRRFDAYERSFNFSVAGSPWTLTLHPTAQLYGSYADKAPARNTIIIVIVVSGFGGLFACYELLVRHRNNALVAALAANLEQVIVLKNEVERASAEGMRQQDAFVASMWRCGRAWRCAACASPDAACVSACSPRAAQWSATKVRAGCASACVDATPADAAAPRSAHSAERGAGCGHAAARHLAAQPGAARAAVRVGRGRRPRRDHRGRQCVHAAYASLPASRLA